MPLRLDGAFDRPARNLFPVKATVVHPLVDEGGVEMRGIHQMVVALARIFDRGQVRSQPEVDSKGLRLKENPTVRIELSNRGD